MTTADTGIELSERLQWMNRLIEGWSIYKKNLLGKIGIILLVLFALMALCSFIPPLLDPMYQPMAGVDPESFNGLRDQAQDIGWEPILWAGIILSQLLTGARIAFMVGVSAAFMSVFLGTAIGMIAGYVGKFMDTLLMRLADMIMVMPALLVLLMLAALFGQLSIWFIVFFIALFRWPGVSRVIRAQTLSLKHRPFIEAAKVAGASNLRIIFRHIMPNVLPLSFLYMTFSSYLCDYH